MAFDQPTRNRLARFVGDSRSLLTEEFTRQLQHEYGLDPTSGEITDLTRLDHLDDARRETARLLRETLTHYLAGQPKQTAHPEPAEWAKTRREALERIVREQAFTILNRLCALRMMEARGLLLESVGQGYQSKGLQLYSRLAGPSLGETGDTYRNYIFSLFDEFAVDLPVLFDRFNPQGRLFPRSTTLLQLLDEINRPDIDPLWVEDETIGWIYQYFNSVEERRQMRSESQAPRNSRELAVRNQFFTPRYVVEFLTDNTLGRIWYEMTQGQTALTESCRYLVRRPAEIFLGRGETVPDQPETEADLSQEELLKQPVYIPHRPLKDPRDIKMLDPACGSMHFGLYAFDLFEQIYTEAWALEAERGPHDLRRPLGLRPLRDTYPDEATFHRDVPRLIIEHNLHGIDIDPRAAQIAGLSLWLRAQKSWQSQGINAAERPAISRSNVVTAEPMPGDAALLDEFIARCLSRTPEEKLLGQLLRRVFEAMKLTGEAGALLKIEKEIAADIAEAKAKWYKKPELKQAGLFEEAAQPEQAELGLDVSSITDEAFWEQAEGRIYKALHAYAEQTENGHTLRRRLFTGDAAKGFAFIDLCQQRYDVVLMNPPFGEPSSQTITDFGTEYPSWNNNILCAFLQRGWEILMPKGVVGAIYDRTAVVKSTYENFRRSVLIPDDRFAAMADLGWGVLDANVEVTTSILSRVILPNGGFFVDARDVSPEHKDEYVYQQLNNFNTGNVSDVVVEYGSSFSKLPNAVIGYDFSGFLRRAFHQLVSIEEVGIKAYQGHALKADKHFRLWWELPQPSSMEFVARMFNGAGYSPYTTSLHDAVIAPTKLEKFPKDSATVLRNKDKHLLPGICFGKRGEFFCTHILPKGHIFTVEGQSIPIADSSLALEVLGQLNTPLVRHGLNKYCGQHKYSGYVNLFPYRRLQKPSQVRNVVQKAIDKHLTARMYDETQSMFSLELSFCTINEHADLIKMAIQHAQDASLKCEDYCHEVSLETYEVKESDQKILNLFRQRQPEVRSPIEDVDMVDGCLWFASHNLLSLFAGLAFGRWDICYATGEKAAPELPDPFAPLPICPPGMLQNSQGLPAAPGDVPPDYPLRISWLGILVDDPGYPEDIENRVREALRVIWPDTADTIEQEACQILGVASLRAYFARPNNFFADHLKRYSKSRRAAPIYWPLSTLSGSYTLWLYYHRLDDQILYTCVNDFVDPKLKDVSRQVQALRQKASRSKTEENDLARLTDLDAELQGFRAELLRLAAFWRPNLNDGVQITAAPLWRLFQHRQWQKKLKDTWEKLEAGDYDWAHLAMPIWPERVVPKCATDRSLAIAHNIEDLFWVEDDGKWRLPQEAEQEIAGQIERRQNPAYRQLGQYLENLAADAGRGIPAYQVWQHLSEGDWDDTRLALALWPERVAEKCWDQPFLAAQLGLRMPGKRTQADRKRFLKKLIKDSTPELESAVAAAFQDEEAAFDAVWQALVNGQQDEQSLALALWPERVVHKCVADVELAIQHDLHRYFWIQPPGSSSWRRRNPQAQEIRDEVARRRGG